MAARPKNMSMITVNGEKYWPTPHELDPGVPEDMVWHQYPYNSLWLSDPNWYDSLGQDAIAQRRIWAIPSEPDQVKAFEQLLVDMPDRALDMMFAAAVKGRPHVIRFLLEQGVKATPNKTEGDDETLVPFHAAAGNGHLDCVKIFIEEVGLSANTFDDLGGTAIMRASWKAQSPEVVRYLLEKGADITVRQKPHPGGEPGTSVFEFAAGGGNVECAKAILAKAQELGLNTSTLATPVALEAAAGTPNDEALGMLDLVLQVGGYPRQNSDGDWEGDIASLTDSKKDALETAFARASRQGQWSTLKPLFAYIDSREEDGSYHWKALRPETIESLLGGILSAVERDDEDHQAAFTYLHDIALSPESRLTTASLQEIRNSLLGDVFFHACEHGSHNMARFLSSQHEIDVNHLSRNVEPLFSSSLYTAAGSGHDKVVESLFSEQGGSLNIHKGTGKFINGPTPLWITVWNGHVSTVELLLCHGGPVEFIDEALTRGANSGRVIATAKKAFRSPVNLISEDVWTREHGALGETEITGLVWDDEGNQIHYVVLNADIAVLQQWDRIQLRKSDDELKSMEKDGRELKERPIASAQ
ncbi:ankyrin repeat-containing domain protein [Truncatella angustata]|uniref:Ankyrin repeat-containing domain protein n=1 Tax=Truncatella angustata TaxID=152316 RepID=A0A9P8UN34_9PEZI|nr:ankyrin repeat-containing domain protein [Truncatella angustata]KAH6655232.1 ankyrin repeat-containing domain protein [Truncatella angustata]KAH8204767.1 hypothetical protein TruAng_001101 [Truncatella angustata]